MTTNRARSKVLADNERADVQRYKELTVGLAGPFHYDVTDLPDEALTGCGRFVLWGKSYDLRSGFEYKQPSPGDKLCSYCVSAVQYQIDFRQEWLDAVKEEQE